MFLLLSKILIFLSFFDRAEHSRMNLFEKGVNDDNHASKASKAPLIIRRRTDDKIASKEDQGSHGNAFPNYVAKSSIATRNRQCFKMGMKEEPILVHLKAKLEEPILVHLIQAKLEEPI